MADEVVLLELFCELSCLLTGEPTIAAVAAARHFATLKQRLGQDTLGEILDQFAILRTAGGDRVAAVQEKLINSASLGPATKAIVLIWFAGTPDLSQGAPGPASEADFFESLMWAAVGAHPPAYSDGYYGHWRYPPDTGF